MGSQPGALSFFKNKKLSVPKQHGYGFGGQQRLGLLPGGGTMLPLWFWFGPAMPPSVLTVSSPLLQSVGIPDILQVQGLHDRASGLHIFLITKEPPNEMKNCSVQVSRVIRGPTLSGNLIVLRQVHEILRASY